MNTFHFMGAARIWAALLLLAAAAATAQAAPRRVEAEYRLLKDGQPVAAVQERFTRSGNRYRIESTSRAIGIFALLAKGSIRLVSSGEVTPRGLRPLHFEHYRGADPAKAIYADFDWRADRLTLRHDGSTQTVALEPGSQDRLSLMYQFMFLRRYPAELSFYMTNGKTLYRYRYRRVGTETVTTPAGVFETLHYSREHRPDENGTDVWLATKRHHFPVRVLIEEEGGGTMEQILTRLTIQ